MSASWDPGWERDDSGGLPGHAGRPVRPCHSRRKSTSLALPVGFCTSDPRECSGEGGRHRGSFRPSLVDPNSLVRCVSTKS